MERENYPTIPRSEFTETILDEILNIEPIDADDEIELLQRINNGITAIESQPRFLEGLAERLSQLGVTCCADDKEIMLTEVKRRYNDILGFGCPRAVKNWIHGTRPSMDEPQNNYDLCYALELDFKQTIGFFQKYFLTQPFNAKSRIDAIFMYTLYHNKPYSVARELMERSKGFVNQKCVQTSTLQIYNEIRGIDDDESFLNYLSEHCYEDKQQYMHAREIIYRKIKKLQEEYVIKYSTAKVSSKRLNAKTIEFLLGYNYQAESKNMRFRKLPKLVTESIPVDGTLGKIIKGEKVSYELLRKTLVLLHFNLYYLEAAQMMADDHAPKLVSKLFFDFHGEMNDNLMECGFSRLYECNPFDCMILYCAYSKDPIGSLHEALAPMYGGN